jgi:hypothetical protein
MSEVLDILNEDLSSVDTSLPALPLLNKGDYVFEVKKCERIESNKTPGNFAINIGLSLTQPATSPTGETVPAGAYVWDRINLQPSGGLTKEMIQKSLKAFRQACTGNAEGAFGDPAQYIGSHVTARIKIRPAKDGYDESNAVSYYKTN